MKPQGVAGAYSPAESRLVDASEERYLSLVLRERQCAYRTCLRQHFYHQDARLHRPDGPWQTVFGLDTLPEYRRRGVAAALMNAFIAQAKARGQLGVALTCKAHLVHYYERFGYRNEGVSASVHGGAVWYDMVLRF